MSYVCNFMALHMRREGEAHHGRNVEVHTAQFFSDWLNPMARRNPLPIIGTYDDDIRPEPNDCACSIAPLPCVRITGRKKKGYRMCLCYCLDFRFRQYPYLNNILCKLI